MLTSLKAANPIFNLLDQRALGIAFGDVDSQLPKFAFTLGNRAVQLVQPGEKPFHFGRC